MQVIHISLHFLVPSFLFCQKAIRFTVVNFWKKENCGIEPDTEAEKKGSIAKPERI